MPIETRCLYLAIIYKYNVSSRITEQQTAYEKSQVLAKYAMGAMRLNEVRLSHVQAYINLRENMSGTTIVKYSSVLKSMFKAALQERLIIYDPCVSMKNPKHAPKGRHKYLDQEIQDLIDSTWREHLFGPAMMLMMHAGLRISEVMAFDCDKHIDWDRHMIKVEAAAKRTTDKEKKVKTSLPKYDSIGESPIDTALEEVLHGRHGHILVNSRGKNKDKPAYYEFYQSMFKGYKDFLEMKLNGVKKCKASDEQLANWKVVALRTHDGRVTFTTNSIEKGAALETVRRFTRHKSLSVMLDSYVQQSSKAAQEDIEKITGRKKEHADEKDE
ncbi:hypothetical protein AGMMS49992_32610 [Clostridia bacterium]|nr:hypothetical protein AGMMS49992_32610 [Clostridia bacterium]